jgi:hypothetical protein
MTPRSRAETEAYLVLAEVWWRLLARARDLAARFGLLNHLQHLRGCRAIRRRSARARAAATIAVKTAGVRTELDPEPWRVYEVLSSGPDSGVAILGVGPPREPLRALMKIAERPAAIASVDWERQMLAAMHDDQRVGEWRALVPRVLGTGASDGAVYLIEDRLTGVSLDRVIARSTAPDKVVEEAAAAIRRLHSATARATKADEKLIDRLVVSPVRSLQDALARSRASDRSLALLDEISGRLREALEARPIVLSRVHGDYWLGNVLCRPDGKISGIVDWEFAHPDDLPSLDVVRLLVSVRMWTRRQEFGRVVSDLIADPTWTAGEAQVFASPDDPRIGRPLGIGTQVLLCWLRHTASLFAQNSGYADRGLWMHTNVHAVCAAFARASTGPRGRELTRTVRRPSGAR